MLFAGCFALLQLAGSAHQVERATASQQPDRVERPFPKGGRIVMDLSAGAYRIRGGAADSIRVRWETQHAGEMSSVHTELNVQGTQAALRVRGPRNHFKVDVDVPSTTDIQLDLSAGDLSFRGVEGNKSISMWAGEVTVEVADPNLYRTVDVTVRAGEISGGPFGGSRGGLFRSFQWSGSGRYSIVARLTAGEVRFVK